jgi:hypothetical protein
VGGERLLQLGLILLFLLLSALTWTWLLAPVALGR